MLKNIKKLLVSLGIAMLITTSVGHAQSYVRYNNYSNYNRYNRTVYVYNYNNYYRNWSTQFSPFYWEKIETPNKDVETPKKDSETPKDSQQKNDNTKTETNKDNIKDNTEINNNIGNNANSSIEMEVVRLVNIERQKEGLAPLNYSEELSKVARTKSQDMAQNNYFSHNSPTYGDPFSMMKSFGIKYRTAGENIAKGYLSAESVVRGWMNSSGHRANILNPSFGKIGVGYVNINGTTYWTQMFTD